MLLRVQSKFKQSYTLGQANICVSASSEDFGGKAQLCI